MLFNSFAFWLFFLVVIVIYHRLKHRAQNWFLLAASYFFYGCWDWRFLGLILLSTIVDYCVALGISTSTNRSRKKLLLATSICVNLGILAFFKYYGFFAAELDSLLTTLGVPFLLPSFHIILPVGISFYTFQTMSYTIDVYRGHCQPTRSLLDFAVYVSFFPQLVAGPIERATHFLPQVTGHRSWQPEFFREGLALVLLGLFKKVVVADNMAVLVNAVFATPVAELSSAEILLGVYAFAFQIYGDFSGYSSIARGIAKWLGFDLMQNFRRPYFAVDPSDFWRRWHISLSQWLRDYLYIPLGGNRGGVSLVYRNLMLTMVLGGLWHGANWTFLVWGFIHGLILCAYRASPHLKQFAASQGIGRIIPMLVMFHLVCVTWLFFRAETISQAGSMLLALAGPWEWTPLASMMLGMILFYAGPLMLGEAWAEFRPQTHSLLDLTWPWRAAIYAYTILMCLFFPPPAASTFIYFQF